MRSVSTTTLMYSHCFGTTAERSHCGQHIIHDRNKEDRKAQYTQYYQTAHWVRIAQINIRQRQDAEFHHIRSFFSFGITLHGFLYTIVHRLYAFRTFQAEKNVINIIRLPCAATINIFFKSRQWNDCVMRIYRIAGNILINTTYSDIQHFTHGESLSNRLLVTKKFACFTLWEKDRQRCSQFVWVAT